MEERKLIELDLSVLSEEVIEVLLLDSTNEESFINEIAQKNTHRPELLRRLLSHPLAPERTREFIAKILNVSEPEEAASVPTDESYVEETSREHFRSQGLLQRIQKMKVGEKIQLALRGSKDIRTILLRDTNKEVMLTVLDNPKLTETELELLAKQRTTPDEILRSIAKKREWVRSYPITHALITNPKTPIAITLRLVPNLRSRDLASLEKNRNIPEAVRAAVKKRIAVKKQ